MKNGGRICDTNEGARHSFCCDKLIIRQQIGLHNGERGGKGEGEVLRQTDSTQPLLIIPEGSVAMSTVTVPLHSSWD